MSVPPIKRLFLVGCPRSGTTLLQSLVAAHSQITSFPESHFFTRIISSRAILKKFGLAAPHARAQFNSFMDLIGHPELQRVLPRLAVSTRQYAQAFTTVLDTITRNRDKHVWLEKTPRHLNYIEDISALVPEAKFIHLIRNGTDVVASLYEAVNGHPDIWRSLPANNLEQLIQRWIDSIALSQQYAGMPNHCMVRYEHLVESTQSVLTQICRFIDVPFEPDMLEGFHDSAATLILPYETWKQSAPTKIENVNQKKFNRLFDDQQQQYIKQQIAHVQLDEFTPLTSS